MESAIAKAGAVGQSTLSGHKSLITDEPWDCYHLESVLPLKETYRENTEFGFLLRHYWIPATILTFRQSSRTTFADGRVEQCELEIERKMARCRSNECLWREKIRPVVGANGDRPILSEMLCSYDCYGQTYVSAKPILFAPPTSDRKTEARRQALYRLPILCPPGPVPVGFSWYGKVGDDYMNFHLDTEEHLGETSVLVIRREGRYTVWIPEERVECSPHTPCADSGVQSGPEHKAKTNPVLMQRQGVTLFAWNRGAVLEDRFLDQVVEVADHLASTVGAMTQVVTRLVRSCPVIMAKPRPSATGRRPQCGDVPAAAGQGIGGTNFSSPNGKGQG